MRIIIIGAGPTGLGAAYRLLELGVEADYHQVLIFEKSEHPGGLASTVRDNQGFTWDLGGHLISSNYNYFDQVIDTGPNNFYTIEDNVRIFTESKFQSSISYIYSKNFHIHNYPVKNSFKYPISGGIGSIWQKLSQKLPIHWLNYRMSLVEIRINERCLYIKDMENSEIFKLRYDILISSLPLDSLLHSIQEKEILESIDLKHYSIHVLGLGLKGSLPDKFKNKNTLYFPEESLYKVTLSGIKNEEWSILAEVYSSLTRKEIFNSLIEKLKEYEILKDEKKILCLHYQYIPYAFPHGLGEGPLSQQLCETPSLAHPDKYGYLLKINSWLESHKIYSRGMFGRWEYANQDECFMQGVRVVDKIINGIPEENDSDRLIFELPRRVPLVTYVIAHYQENLSWLKQLKIADKCHVYHKGGQTLPCFDVWKWESLPNVGREAHTYLKYIIDNYDHLPEIVVFLQGRIDDHTDKVYQNPYQYVWEAQVNGLSFARLEIYRNWGRIKHNGIWLTKQQNGSMKDATLTLGEFWKVLFKTDHPEQIIMSHHACFGVKREKILARSLEFYKTAISYVSDHPDPEIGHYFERLWYSVFSLG